MLGEELAGRTADAIVAAGNKNNLLGSHYDKWVVIAVTVEDKTGDRADDRYLE